MANRNRNKGNQPSASLAVAQTQLSATYSSGPIPDAEQLAKYDSVCQGAAHRIIAMAENQSEHRQAIEKTVVKTNARNSTLGVIAAFILGVLTIVGGVFLAYNGRELSGAVLGGTGLVGLATVFIYGTRSSRRERTGKYENNH